MDANTNEVKVELDYIDGFTEKSESINLPNGTILNMLRYDGAVSGCVMNFQLEDGIDDIIKYFENDLKVADGITIYLDILEESHFTPANILSGIKAIIKDTCDISFNISVKDKPESRTTFIIVVYADSRRNIRKNKYLQKKNLEVNSIKEIHELPN